MNCICNCPANWEVIPMDGWVFKPPYQKADLYNPANIIHCLQRLHVLISHHLLNSLFEISLGILLADVASFELIRR